MLRLGPRRRARRPSLTPMIDVVFLLLVFFMLASRFGIDTVMPLNLAGSQGEQRNQGPPRLIDVLSDGLRLNGVAVAEHALAVQLAPLVETESDLIVIRAGEGVVLQRLVETMAMLKAAGHVSFVMVE
ncbi:biopolymer transporter ExbD [Actibacterium sp. 188UL27-1]|uniref:ExbD/TolR family protein n=1 Tax=Actibacterium sp. 188UL27-1 TaxID=2786961 RepID=UPI00195B64AE|nr:biopolymer transporter ExbD [Actibacterium sp. 188UL27-1]MBM7067082.1 biopolymer transporter ExbD [Actibacterium sp. 188UL27-1]